MMLMITIYLKSTFLIAGTNSKLPHKYHIGILYLKSVLEYIVSKMVLFMLKGSLNHFLVIVEIPDS